MFLLAIGWGGAGHQSGRAPQCLVVLASNQEGLPAQWLVCTSHQSGSSPRPMANMYWPSIREVSPPDGRYVPANDQGGLPAQWPVCPPTIDLWWLVVYVCIYMPMYVWHWPFWRLESIRNWFLEIFFPFYDFFF
jgi:hypothetical protein